MQRTYMFRLYPKASQVAELERTLAACRHLYNSCIEERQKAWADKQSLTRWQQEAKLSALRRESPEFGAVYCHVLQDVVRRVDLAFKAFFRRCKAGETPGYPRFRAAHRYDSFSFKQPGNGCVKFADGKVSLSKVCANIRMFQHRPIRGKIQTVTIMRKASGWHIAVSCDDVPPDPNLISGSGTVGIDVGLSHFATLSTGEAVSNPRFLAKAEDALARRQRVLSGKTKGSGRYRKARHNLQRAWERISNQRRDFQFKTARSLVQRFDHIAVERLAIKDMVQSNGTRGLHRGIGDAAWRGFLNALSSKAEEAGSTVVFVEARGTTRRCSRCGADVPKPLWERRHICPCGLDMDRDRNAALNILERARTEPSWRAALEPPVEARSPCL